MLSGCAPAESAPEAASCTAREPGWLRLYVQGASGASDATGAFPLVDDRRLVASGDHFLMSVGSCVEAAAPPELGEERLVESLPHARALPPDEAAPARAARSAAHLPGQHLPGNTGSEHEEDAAQNRAIANRRTAMPMAAPRAALRDQRFESYPDRIIDEGLRHARPYQAARLGTRGPSEF